MLTNRRSTCYSVRQILRISALSALMGLGGSVGAGGLPAWSESILSRQDLLAQQVVDGLPPPPPADLSNFPPPPPATPTPASGDQLYMVYVNGSSPLLLEQVRQVQPDALIQEYNGQPIILVGAYENQALADQQINALQERGIGATLSPVSSLIFEPESVPAEDGFAAVPELPPADPNATLPTVEVAPASSGQAARELEFGPVPTAVAPSSSPVAAAPSQPPPDDSYYIVIPGSTDDLPQVREQVLLLGARQDVVSQREAPLGPHVLVGPFTNRQAASRWNRFLRDFGMNSRVYYRR